MSIVWMVRIAPLGRAERRREERPGRASGRSVLIRHEASEGGLGLGSQVGDLERWKAARHQLSAVLAALPESVLWKASTGLPVAQSVGLD